MESLVTNLHREWGDRVNLLTFCEYAVTGFDPQRLREAAETVPGPATERLARLARNTGYYICNGSMLERDGTDLFNTAIIFSPEGEIVHRYRKTHPWCPPVGGEDICFGREFPVTEIPLLHTSGLPYNAVKTLSRQDFGLWRTRLCLSPRKGGRRQDNRGARNEGRGVRCASSGRESHRVDH
jgi:Carbon-nitrogen hydrolase